MKVSALNNFVCPVDGLPLVHEPKTLRCEKGHVFDVAREGYCNLLLVQQKASLDPGDNKKMVAARQRFLDGGYFNPMAEKLFEMLRSDKLLSIVDAGCGEGYYLNRLKELAKGEGQISWKLAGCDISKWAIKAAAKRSEENFQNIAWAVAANKQLPFAPGQVDVILSIFGFPDWEKFKKILSKGGRVILIEPGPEHLIELRKIIYADVNVSGPFSAQSAVQHGYVLTHEALLKFSIDLKNNALQDLLAMTPHAFRITKQAREKVEELDHLAVTIDVVFRVLQVRS